MSNNTLNIDRILPMNIDPISQSCIRMRQEKSGVMLGGKFNVRFIRILCEKISRHFINIGWWCKSF